MPNIWEKPFTQAGGSSSQLNPFFDSNNLYGADQSYNNSPVSSTIREQNPQLAYSQYGNNLGVGGQNQNFQQWFYNQYPEFQRGYGQATMVNPYITIDDYMKTLPSLNALMQRFQQLAPTERGLRNSLYAPIARWINR